MMTFKLAPDLNLPASAVTDTASFVGTRGSGKTYAAGKMVEEMLDGRAQVVVVDPVGVWYGLRLASTGRGRGFDVPIFGGDHGDVPLEPTAGKLVAQLVVEKRTSVVLDVSPFTVSQQRRFVTDFASELFQLKKKDRSPLHVVFDEAHEFLPQFPQATEAEMVGVVKRLVKVGRNYGIGVTLISQRPAEVNKGALNLTERMFCGKLKGAQDRKAMEGWARDNDADESALDRLPSLKPGELLAWSSDGINVVRFFQKRTFDSSKTPEPGDFVPTDVPKIDLDAVRTAMAGVVEEAKANDPRALKARIVELEKQLAARPAPAKEVVRERVFDDGDRYNLERYMTNLEKMEASFVSAMKSEREEFNARMDELAQRQQVVVTAVDSLSMLIGKTRTGRAVLGVTLPTPTPAKVPVMFHGKVDASNGVELGRCPLALLGVLAQRGVASASQVAALSGYRKTSSTFANGLSALRVAGYIVGGSDRIEVTEAGRRAAGPTEALPRGPELLDYWLRRLGKCEATLLSAVYQAKDISRQELANATGYSITSSTFANGLSGLKTLDLVVTAHGGPVTIAPVFVE